MLRSRSHPLTFKERLAVERVRLEKRASQLDPGPERDDLLKKAQQIDTTTQIHDRLGSPGLQPLRECPVPRPVPPAEPLWTRDIASALLRLMAAARYPPQTPPT